MVAHRNAPPPSSEALLALEGERVRVRRAVAERVDRDDLDDALADTAGRVEADLVDGHVRLVVELDRAARDRRRQGDGADEVGVGDDEVDGLALDVAVVDAGVGERDDGTFGGGLGRDGSAAGDEAEGDDAGDEDVLGACEDSSEHDDSFRSVYTRCCNRILFRIRTQSLAGL